MPNFSGVIVTAMSNGKMEIALNRPVRFLAEELDKTQVTELVSFLQSWLEEQDNEFAPEGSISELHQE